MATTTREETNSKGLSTVFDILSRTVSKVERIEKALEPILTEVEQRKGEHAGEEGKTKLIGALFEINDKLENVLKRIVL